jgi:hypothetical protein
MNRCLVGDPAEPRGPVPARSRVARSVANVAWRETGPCSRSTGSAPRLTKPTAFTICSRLHLSMACRDASRHRARPRLPDTEDGLPRRSAHVAAQGRRHVKKPEVQNVLMRKSHVTSADMSPDTEAVAAYNEVFQSPLHSTQRRAIRALFSACPSPGEVDDELPA